MRLGWVAAVIALAASTACKTFPGATLEAAKPAGISLPAGAWIAPAVIADPWVDDEKKRHQLEQTLTLSLASYVADSGYFERVNRLPGKVQPGEYVLRFQFDHYRTDKSMAWGSVLGAMTYGLYDMFGGTTYTVVSEVGADLSVEDPDGKQVFHASAERKDSYPGNRYSEAADERARAHSRTELVRSVLTMAVRGLQP